ncbi:reverse transcriptase domain-containing protein [Tanacetum coccineum]|uniref:Reverse transcriptase domain-containing protein n=1 Tax=Tanacetum coccineum TaxID=301880 RepID=A0ABQ5HH23_9ASTR
MLERLAGNEFYCFLDGFSGYFQIPIDPHDQEKMTFTCPYGTFALSRIPFGVYCFQCFRKPLREEFEATRFLVVPDWEPTFRIKCDTSDYALGAVLGQQFDITILDKKGSENLAADHLSRLENPHKDVLENKDINEHFPLETLGSFIKRKFPLWTVGKNSASWSDKLDDALWAFRTAFKTPIECTPYQLVYGKSCHLPVELEHKAYWALKRVNFEIINAGVHRKLTASMN